MKSGKGWGRRVAVLAVTTAAMAASGVMMGAQPAAAAVCSTRWEQGNAASSLCSPFINGAQHRVWVDCVRGNELVRVYGSWQRYGLRSYASCITWFDVAKGLNTRNLSCIADGPAATRDESVNC